MQFNKKKTLIVILVLVTGGLALAFTAKEPVSNPPVTGEIKLPAEVQAILERACYDCHSNETTLSWFDKLPIASTIVTDHVTKARARLNFSSWNSLSPADQQSTLWLMYNKVAAGQMPLPDYKLLHPDSKISQTDLSVLREFLNTVRTPSAKDSNQQAVNDRLTVTHNRPVSPNGIVYDPSYRNWQVLSTTSRYDNGTMRVMYANPVAIAAVKNGQIHPWPEGSMIAKLVFRKLEDKEGNIRPGEFLNIQYMIRDSKKFATTEGWGFARFDTKELKPYGNINTEKTCISCHKLVEETGFVFDVTTK
jgi:RNA polymerase subunit RPABC4/transcription elongation factor Spt4